MESEIPRSFGLERKAIKVETTCEDAGFLNSLGQKAKT
jgi:hypothetical protein